MKPNSKHIAQLYLNFMDDCEKKNLEKQTAVFFDFISQTYSGISWKEVLRSLDSLWKKHYGISEISIQSATELNASTKTSLEKTFKGASVKASIKKELLSGALIQIDDKILDGSLLGQLTSLKNTLSDSSL